MLSIKEYINKKKLLTDGSFGTYYSIAYQTWQMPEEANIRYPERVRAIHKSYLDAGARLLRTNTFAANTVLMNRSLDDVKEIIRKAICIAREAVRGYEDVFIAGDIGPIPNDRQAEGLDIEEEYYQLAKTYIEEGLNILTFETFSDLLYLKKALVRIRSEYDVFIMVQFRIDQFGYSNSGISAKKLLPEASGLPEIDALGLNCGIGPAHMVQILEQVVLPSDKYLIALPNAGYPKRIRGRLEYTNNPDYFARKSAELLELGADIIGGCCGTNPTFIRRMSETLDFTQKERISRKEPRTSNPRRIKQTGFFYEKDGAQKKKKLIAVELAPPLGADDEKLLEAAHILKNSQADVVTFPDSPSGRTRIDSVLMAEKVMLSTGLTVMPHICCRDKNSIAMRSLLLGAHINHIENLLIITGDPIPSMDRQSVKSVFNFDSVGLMKIIQEMNEENFAERPLTYGGAINQGRLNLNSEIGRVRRKIEAGAQFFLTQPVFSKEEADRIRQIKEETGARILCGIMPLISRKNAYFMGNEISGIYIPDEIISRYPEHASKAEGEAVGIAIAKEMIEYTKDFSDGYYFSFPFNRVYMLEQIINCIND